VRPTTDTWQIELPGAPGPLRFEVADPGRHTPLLHDWLRRPHVAPWWGAERDEAQTRAYLERQLASGHLVPWVVSADGRPFGYTETYRAAADPLADHYPLEATDRGWHVLVGPPEHLGTGLPRLLGRAVLAYLLSDPLVGRVVCEPDERNGRMLAFCRALGFDALATLDLPDKRAALLACTREAHAARWPDDLAALTSSAPPSPAPSPPAKSPGSHREHDVIGVGIGPFNLGLAALLAPLDELDAVFFDAKPEFSWHAGLLLDGTTLQVPFLADLVTLADPTSPYSFLNYLHCRQRLYRFYFYERFHVPRREYDAYCRWVAQQLPSCRFGHRVVAVEPADGERWSVLVTSVDDPSTTVEHRADAVVLGVGSSPSVPAVAVAHLGETVLHSASYLAHRDRALAAAAVMVIGSGQSAAEIVADLLTHSPGRGAPPGRRLDWFTRSRGFLPMEYSKLGLEHFTPEYTAYFHRLPQRRRDAVRAGQDLFYKGISAETSARIYDGLYEASIDGAEPEVGYRSACELQGMVPLPSGAPRRWRLSFHHLDEGVTFTHDTDLVVLATGYRPTTLPLGAGWADQLVERDDQGRPVVELDYRVRLADRAKSTLFVQNAELHSHGVGAPDLGLGAHRSAVLVNALAGREVYPVRDRNVFQTFGAPPTNPPPLSGS